MAILAIFTGKGINKSQYDALRKEVDWEHHQPEGLTMHVAGFDASGAIHVADIWESREALDRFFETRLLPAMRKLHVTAPSGEFYPLHNGNAYPEIERLRAVALAR